jgi:CMP-N-acetylneuraminic acid synthetase/regulator of RNase E activity RraA
MKVAVIVPAKSTSERVSNKNIQILEGEELYLRALKKAKNIPLVDEVSIDPDSEDMAKNAETHLGVKILLRDKKYATNKTDGNLLLLQAAEKVDADVYVQLLCTAPFLSEETITKAIQSVVSGESDSAVAVKENKEYLWEDNKPLYDSKSIPNSVDLDPTVSEAMSLYVITNDELFNTETRVGTNPVAIPVGFLESIDINNQEDLAISRDIVRGIRCQELLYFNTVKILLSSSLLSDVADDLGIKVMLPHGFVSNFGSKILGRARTLVIEPLTENKNWQGIYDGLKLYDYVEAGDVIFVNTEVPELAFFGELNAALSVRSGAIGTIVNGFTRDISATMSMEYPVYAQGFFAKDVRKRATVKDMNVPTVVDDIIVNTGDVIFADSEGVCILPASSYKDIISMAIKKIKVETDILIDIVENNSYEDIISEKGFF